MYSKYDKQILRHHFQNTPDPRATWNVQPSPDHLKNFMETEPYFHKAKSEQSCSSVKKTTFKEHKTKSCSDSWKITVSVN